jgi:peptidoglycan hydrolase-like protein with peptidoglycan-binding domain
MTLEREPWRREALVRMSPPSRCFSARNPTLTLVRMVDFESTDLHGDGMGPWVASWHRSSSRSLSQHSTSRTPHPCTAGEGYSGYFGSVTREALSDWQRDSGISVTGTFNSASKLEYLKQKVGLRRMVMMMVVGVHDAS